MTDESTIDTTTDEDRLPTRAGLVLSILPKALLAFAIGAVGGGIAVWLHGGPF